MYVDRVNNDPNNEIICYRNHSDNQMTSSKRFSILMKMSKTTMKFFQPLSEWKSFLKENNDNNDDHIVDYDNDNDKINNEYENDNTNSNDIYNEKFIPVHVLSNFKNSFLAQSFPYTESFSYHPPFFIIVKAQLPIASNYLDFESFLKPNTESSVLAMLNYNELEDSFEMKYSMDIFIPFTTSLQLSKVLEFVIVDTHGKIVNVENESQLFICLQMYEKKFLKKSKIL